MKNEADIVRPFLEDASEWADRIFVYDNGSTDGTWEIVQSMASEVIVPWKREEVPFHNDLRADVFHAFKHEAEPGDWWCFRMDADEFYLDDPRAFLANVPKKYHTVAKQSVDFYVTAEDLAEYTFTGDFAADRDKIRYVSPKMIVESRFFRHRDSIIWQHRGRRTFIGITCPDMIRVKHYKWRSPQQIQKRLVTKHEYLQRKAILKGRMDENEADMTPVADDAWKGKCPQRKDLIEYTGPETVAQLCPHKTQAERGWNYLKKRLLYILRIRK